MTNLFLDRILEFYGVPHKSLWLKILLVRNTYACFSMMGLDAGIRVLRFHPLGWMIIGEEGSI